MGAEEFGAQIGVIFKDIVLVLLGIYIVWRVTRKNKAKKKKIKRWDDE